MSKWEPDPTSLISNRTCKECFYKANKSIEGPCADCCKKEDSFSNFVAAEECDSTN